MVITFAEAVRQIGWPRTYEKIIADIAKESPILRPWPITHRICLDEAMRDLDGGVPV